MNVDDKGGCVSATLDAAVIRQWLDTALDALEHRRDEINALNVYPVPDGDTGTNMVLTMRAVLDELPDDATLPDLLRSMAHGALMGARGNSGVILSQLLRGFADALATEHSPSADELRTALRRAADLGYEAVAHPVEGTVLTVARAAGDAAESTTGDDPLVVAVAAAAAARQALVRTPEQLDVLAEAGVVDAGGSGFVVLLDALVDVLHGNGHVRDDDARHVVEGAVDHARRVAPPTYAYEVQYLLRAPDQRIGELKERLDLLGDSLAVVGGDGLWNVHVHVDDVPGAIAAGMDVGEPTRISVSRFERD